MRMSRVSSSYRQRFSASSPCSFEAMRPTRPPPNKMPEAVSNYIIEFYVKNADVLLTNTSLRTMEANTQRALAIRKLIAELQEQFGYSATERRIRNHFDHVRSKCLSKAGGLGLSGGERNRFVHAERNAFGEPRKRVFLNSGEQALVRFYKGMEADNDSREQGTSQQNPMFMKESFNRMHAREEDHQHSAAEEVEVKEESRPADLSDDCVIEELTGFDEEESNDNGRIDADSPTCPFSHACESSSEAMNELRLLCMEQRQFFREMTEMAQEVCSFVRLAKEQLLERPSSSKCSLGTKAMSSAWKSKIAKSLL